MKKIISFIVFLNILILLLVQFVTNFVYAQTTITVNSTESVPGNKCLTKENCSDGKLRFRVNKDAACDHVGIDTTTGSLIIKTDGKCNDTGVCLSP